VTTSKRITAARLDAALDAINSPGARERVGMFRAFVEKTGVQSVFVNTTGDMDAHVALARQSLKDQSFNPAGMDPVLRMWVEPLKGARGYTGTFVNHVVVHTDSVGSRAKEFTAKPSLIEKAARRVLNGADDASKLEMLHSVSSGMNGWDEKEFGTYLHEMGHQVHNKAGLPSPPMTIQGSATNYGSVNEQEWFAEHFAIWMLDAPAYTRLDPDGAKFIQDTLTRATENPISIDELKAGRRS
jgi:hypothetical protein